MYTQCPDCSAVLEITASDLAVAGGFARCGQCGKSFDALRTISDAVPETKPAPDTAPEQSPADEDDKAADAAAAAPDGGMQGGQSEADDSVVPAKATEQSLADEEDEVVEPAAAAPGDDEQTGQSEADVTVLEVGADEALATDTEDDDQDDKAPEAAASADDEQAGQSEADVTVLDVGADEALATDTEDDDDATSDDNAEDDSGEVPAVTTVEKEAVDEEDDEILLDESYQPPEVDDEESFLDDEWDDDDESFTDTEAADGSEDSLFAGFDDGADESIDADVVASLPETETASAADRPEDTADSEEAVDESALFSLPLPELTALDRDHDVVIPEKMEGGAAAQDPFAQTAVSPGQPELPEPPEPPPAALVSSAASDAYDAEDARDLRDYLRAPGSRAATIGWSVGAALMTLLLVGQIVHRNRGDLVIHPRFGPAVSSLYGVAGGAPRPNWRISEYKVVGQARLFEMPADETTDNADDSTALRFVAIISNGADLPQPAPMVRLTLRDRWGDPTGIRDFTPPEYLADRALVGELLEPGQRLRVVLNLYDPGTDVVGFDFDMCLPDGAGTLRCADEG
ncbi:MAG: DUF3426 domain-containing protein [Gammaproteobacteria bacterium]|nr:DUF3426 domain-containing protein [Gammaproteobacteria bacterium]